MAKAIDFCLLVGRM